MNKSEYIFIGSNDAPFFMIEISRQDHKAIIFKPDKYSKKFKDYFEQYYLGEVLHEFSYEKIIYIKDDAKCFNKIKDFKANIFSEIVIRLKNNKYLLIKNDVQLNNK